MTLKSLDGKIRRKIDEIVKLYELTKLDGIEAMLTKLAEEMVQARMEKTGETDEEVRRAALKKDEVTNAALESVMKESLEQLHAKVSKLTAGSSAGWTRKGWTRKAPTGMLYTKSALEAHADKAAIETWDPLKPGFYFLTRAAVLDLSATQLQRMQEMRDSKLLVKVLIDLNDAFQGKGLIKSVLFVSHRWEDPATPDETGAQLAAIKAHLLAHPEIQFVWLSLIHISEPTRPY